MPNREDVRTLLDRLETILGRLEASMPVWNDGAALLVQLESTLTRLDRTELRGPQAHTARLEALAAQGRLLERHLSDALQAMERFTSGEA
ncbi:hypothetical protein [Mesoterricola silvestris]|uniref:Uncharacterized protein n=1 Tax=Mesoterricola silvestris TaxID=2927979 RepID=A0AA48H8I4_9BACT|nr:hypothetical protein [Mesoterricola silvestris]BDU73743.1 hypothetical protein METEAL_29170 [Mesoterricola silvestris]